MSRSHVAAGMHGAAVAVTVSSRALQAEIDAILDVVPHGCRSHAGWAVPLLLSAARRGGITHPRRIAYVLASAHHIARFGAQLVETSPLQTADEPDPYFDRYEPDMPQGAALGNTLRGDGARFRGRGFIYIRGRANYTSWSRRLGLPDQLVDDQPVPFLVAQPDALAGPQLAAQTLVAGMRDGLFTGVALGHYVNDKKTDYYNARRVINASAQGRDVAELALVYQTVMERVANQRHGVAMQQLTVRHAADGPARDTLQEVRDALERLAARGETMTDPAKVLEWNGEPRQGKFVQLDDRTCALHMGRGIYVRLDIQRDLNGIVPPEGKNIVLKRSGDVRPALRGGATEFWR